MAGQQTVAGVAAFIVVAVGLLALAGPATGQPGSPVPGTPYPSVPCDVEPRTIQELAALEAAATPLPDTSPVTIDIGEPPRGVPADAETVAGVSRTVQQLVACHLAGDGLRLAALFSDDLLRVVAGSDGSSLIEFATPTPSPNRDEYLAAVEVVQLLPDGRVSALVTRGGVEDGHPAPGKTALMFFVREGDRWLIEAIYDEIWPTRSSARPTAAADLRPTSVGGTPTPTPPA